MLFIPVPFLWKLLEENSGGRKAVNQQKGRRSGGQRGGGVAGEACDLHLTAAPTGPGCCPLDVCHRLRTFECVLTLYPTEEHLQGGGGLDKL